MADITNSSIREWINFNGTLPRPLEPCQWYLHSSFDWHSDLVDVNCSHVCNSSQWLFLPETANLVTCGEWSTLLAGIWNAFQVIPIEMHFADALKPFKAIGLEADDVDPRDLEGVDWGGNGDYAGHNAIKHAIVTASLITSCFANMYSRANSFSSDTTANPVPFECTINGLFMPRYRGGDTLPELLQPLDAGLKTCLEKMCSPRNLNTDLAGIGVSVIEPWDICPKKPIDLSRFFHPSSLKQL